MTTTPIRVLSTLGVLGVVRDLLPAAEAAGFRPEIRFDPTARLVAAIEAGERADIAILTAEGIAAQAAAGVLDGATQVDLCRSSVGVAVRAGAPHPDISTPEAFRAALLAAPTLAYSRAGASGIFFAGLIERLGIAAEVNAKATIIPGGFTAERAASGDCELAVQQISELMVVPGIDIVGPLPPGAESATTFSAAVFLASSRREAADRLAKAFRSPEAAAMFKSMGLEPAA
jgi:molybdate transport system substrate-binding protein